MVFAQSYEEFFGQTVLGIDEAGRGPLAGPVVAAGVILDAKRPIKDLRDSKKLTAKAREILYQEIMERAVFVTVKEADSATIDRINILKATQQAMREVLIDGAHALHIDVALIDGHLTVPGFDTFKQIAIKKGDSLVDCIMAASIIAKVHRDRLMKKFHRKHPGYGFSAHKGYGTKSHLEALKELGPSPIHRKSFAPVKELIL